MKHSDAFGRLTRRARRKPDPKVTGPAFLDMGEDFHRLYALASPFTMTSVERMYSVFQATNYVIAANVPGDFVECGVWRGGSSMMIALTAIEAGDHRPLWLYDTFTGMTAPAEHDRSLHGEPAADELDKFANSRTGEGVWSRASLGDVEANISRTGYPRDRLRLVEGKVEETIPGEIPDRIALLRLDTDWYESTKHELEHLWSRLTPGGVLIIDDYGHWQGARKATDEFFAEHPVLLQRIDYTARMVIKTTA